MTKQQALQLFEERKVRSVWDNEQKSGTSRQWMWHIAKALEDAIKDDFNNDICNNR